jgi:hypothetical protein
VKSNENAKRPRVVPSLEMKLIFTAGFEADKLAVDIGCEHRIPPTTIRTNVTDKQKYKDDANSAVPGTIMCLRTRENVLLKMEQLLTSIFDQGDNANSTHIRQKAKTVFNNLKASLYWCLFIQKMCFVLKFMASLG